VAVFRDRDSDARKEAAEALGKIGDARAVDPLVAGLKHHDSAVRDAAAEALEKIGDARAVESLKQYRAKLAKQQEQDRARLVLKCPRLDGRAAESRGVRLLQIASLRCHFLARGTPITCRVLDEVHLRHPRARR
jgi:HEAT repeat protein